MPKPRNSQLEHASNRLRLPTRRKPFWVKLAPGIALGYRRNAPGSPGSWSVRSSDGGAEWIKKLALADDLEPSCPPHVLTFWEAQAAARALARRQPGDSADETRPATVAEALDAYAADLVGRAGNSYNAAWPLAHLGGTLLAKPVGLLSYGELRRWRDSLLAKGLTPSSINRLRNSVRAALELAAKHDRRITNYAAWRDGLQTLADSQQARNVVLSDDEVRRLVGASYAHDHRFGLLIDVLATTGARPSQVARLMVGDLRADPLRPALMMPRSSKGGSRVRSKRKAERYSVPISPSLGAQLAQETVGRDPGAALLTRDGTTPWGPNPHANYKRDFAATAAVAGLDPAVTAYSLRHSSDLPRDFPEYSPQARRERARHVRADAGNKL
jgi:integrase